MTEEEVKREAAKQKRLEGLGLNDPNCGICGENHWSTLELHHIAGRKFDDLMVPICSNCHCKVSVDQHYHPPYETDADALLATIGHFLIGLADMLRLILAKLSEFGLALIARSNGNEGASA